MPDDWLSRQMMNRRIVRSADAKFHRHAESKLTLLFLAVQCPERAFGVRVFLGQTLDD